jgi:ribonuclease R
MDTIEKKVLTRLAQDFFRPVEAQELAAAMDLNQDEVRLALSALEEKKVLIRAGEDYCLNPEANMVAGFFQSHVRGYGFVHVGRDRQYYVGPGAAKDARDGDILLCQVLGREPGKAPAVKILDYLARTEKIVAAVYNCQSYLGSVQDGNRKIMIPARQSMSAKDGDCVLAAVPGWEGRVISILDPSCRPYLDLLNIAAKKGIFPVFPEVVEAEAAALEENIAVMDARLDLRDQEVVTVDGEDSQDLDDGFSLTRQPDGTWRLGVHIADVAHYVRPGSQLDQEAFRRAFSVYLVDREVPMLPGRLSRELCSLLPGRDRLAISCLAEISPAGDIIGYQFAETVVRSRARLTYAQVEERRQDLPLLAMATELGQLLNARRISRGAAYIDLPAAAIVLDAEGRPESMGPRESGGPRALVEEFMVLANELAADFLSAHGASLLYRGNEGFFPGRGEELNAYISRWGYKLDYPPAATELQRLLESLKGRQEELLVSRKLARNLHKSRYSATPLGHYNLAMERYTHFSSPIRRYPDLFVHRQIKQVLNRQSLRPLERDLPRVAEQCSYRERLTQDIEGECLDQKKLEYIEANAGTLFQGLVTDLTGSGPLVWLDNTADGIVVAGNPQQLETCQPGDKIAVRVHKLDYNAKTIFFAGPSEPENIDIKSE